ncbi:EFR1 family ferrodoxin [Dehalobacterium formicoaceticum]|uniref:EFR1 family ferrodoxin n=1 Tax=Dehalobacterium formicoaceticum TaxID=51515 RepID=A0ABT1Y497_9FIRM|nr:EFR1 family ferrodoxin [Dehalobacterium formicoaceticum]MCR6545698.1 EFR1 family ferrodoxin [Dehalobacterium formicoaceticum]
MFTDIYYFSGTGNSFVVARDIARQLDGELLPMAQMMKDPEIVSLADVIGIVFPVHNVVNGGVPAIVRRFLTRLETLADKYVFAVCTCGGGSGDALINIDNLVKDKGGKLSAGFTIKMPFNCPPFTKEDEQANRFNNWNRKLSEICMAVNAHQQIKIPTVNPILQTLFYPLSLMMHASIQNNYRKLSQAPKAEFDEAVRFVDQSFYVDDNCNGCGICAKVCPVVNIEIIENKPVWLHHCESCLACFSWCPQHAIFGGILSGKTQRYHHPWVTLDDMLTGNEDK